MNDCFAKGLIKYRLSVTRPGQCCIKGLDDAYISQGMHFIVSATPWASLDEEIWLQQAGLDSIKEQGKRGIRSGAH